MGPPFPYENRRRFGIAAIIDLSAGVPFRWVLFLGAVRAEKAERKAIETGRTGKVSR
jgi:hypothetical protein